MTVSLNIPVALSNGVPSGQVIIGNPVVISDDTNPPVQSSPMVASNPPTGGSDGSNGSVYAGDYGGDGDGGGGGGWNDSGSFD